MNNENLVTFPCTENKIKYFDHWRHGEINKDLSKYKTEKKHCHEKIINYW